MIGAGNALIVALEHQENDGVHFCVAFSCIGVSTEVLLEPLDRPRTTISRENGQVLAITHWGSGIFQVSRGWGRCRWCLVEPERAGLRQRLTPWNGDGVRYVKGRNPGSDEHGIRGSSQIISVAVPCEIKGFRQLIDAGVKKKIKGRVRSCHGLPS